jgi:chemotaxis protein methyltransferase CheR
MSVSSLTKKWREMAFTYFFRDWQTIETVADHVIPELTRQRYVNIWDAGCANGPEPYTLAIMFRERMGKFMFRNLHIYASDIDESNQFGEVITKGVYPRMDLQRIPHPIFESYFSSNGSPEHYQISDELRHVVTFQKHDLLSLQPIRDGFGLVVCKNVLLHFTAEQRVAVIRMFHQALAPGGFMVTEQTQKLPEEAEPWFGKVSATAQLFQKR